MSRRGSRLLPSGTPLAPLSRGQHGPHEASVGPQELTLAHRKGGARFEQREALRPQGRLTARDQLFHTLRQAQLSVLRTRKEATKLSSRARRRPPSWGHGEAPGV